MWFAFGLLILLWPAGPVSALELQPSEYNFGEVEIGTSSTTIVSLTSTGSSTEYIYLAQFTVESSPDFSVALPAPIEDLEFRPLHMGPLTRMGDALYFKANDNFGPELWRSNLAPEGTYMVKDINPYYTSTTKDEVHSRHITQLTSVGETLFFVADDGIVGAELWKSDGTEAGTSLVKEFYPGPYSPQQPSQLTSYNGALYFISSGTTPGHELWRSDGTEEGTIIILDITEPENTFLHGLTDIDGMLYFTARRVGMYPDTEIWRSDGTPAGTARVTERRFDGVSTNYNMVHLNGTLIYNATADELGQELWKTDVGGTALVKDIYPGSWTGGPYSARPMGLILFNNQVFFHANDGVHGRELWVSNGTEAGTYMLKDINPDAGDGICGWIDFAVVMDGALYFTGDDGANGCELWKSDGTAEGTFMVKDIVTGPYDSEPFKFYVAEGVLYFTAEDPEHGRELWRSDGTGAGTTRVKDIRLGPQNSHVDSLGTMNGTLYFTAYDDISGQELWKSSEGTEATTTMVTEIMPGLGPSINMDVTYTPSSLGPAEAVFQICCDDIGILQLGLSGSGVSVEPPPGEQIAEVLEFVGASVESGTLSGDGPGNSGEGRLNPLTTMIEAADDLIEGGLFSEACAQLQDIYNRCDGLSPPPDFVAGPASAGLAQMIGDLMDNLGCE